MVVATATRTRLPDEFNGPSVSEWVYAQVEIGVSLRDAVDLFCEEVIRSGQANDFVRQHGAQVVQQLLRSEEREAHPAGWRARGIRPEPVVATPNVFPDTPDAGRVLNMATLRKPSLLEGKWKIGDRKVALGDMGKAQLETLSASEKKRGKAHTTNSIAFRRLATSLAAGETVRDRWDDAGLWTQFQIAEPTD